MDSCSFDHEATLLDDRPIMLHPADMNHSTHRHTAHRNAQRTHTATHGARPLRKHTKTHAHAHTHAVTHGARCNALTHTRSVTHTNTHHTHSHTHTSKFPQATVTFDCCCKGTPRVMHRAARMRQPLQHAYRGRLLLRIFGDREGGRRCLFAAAAAVRDDGEDDDNCNTGDGDACVRA